MPTYSATVDIPAPPEAVFARIADLPSHGDWTADPVVVEPAGEGRYRSTAQAKGKTITADIVVREASAPERFVFDVVDATGRWSHTFSLVPTPAGTRVTRTISGELSPAQLALYWLVLLPIKKPSARASLRALASLFSAA